MLLSWKNKNEQNTFLAFLYKKNSQKKSSFDWPGCLFQKSSAGHCLQNKCSCFSFGLNYIYAYERLQGPTKIHVLQGSCGRCLCLREMV